MAKKIQWHCYMEGDCDGGYIHTREIVTATATAVHPLPSIGKRTQSEQAAFEETKARHTQKLLEAEQRGRIRPITWDNRIPTTLRETFSDISFAGFRAFASSLGIGIRRIQEFDEVIQPANVDPAWLALRDEDPLARIIVRHRLSGRTNQTVQWHVANVEAGIARRRDGYFTMSEASQILADEYPTVSAGEWHSRMRAGFNEKALPFYTEARLKIRDANAIAHSSLVMRADVDSWLPGEGSGYQFPVAESEVNANEYRGKAPKAFRVALEALVKEIESRAAKANVLFDRQAMPGQLKDLLPVAKIFNAKAFHKSDSTIETYWRGNGICRFRQGGRDSRSDLYRELFPRA